MSKVYDGIMGVVVGDALGLPVQFSERDSYLILDMVGSGAFDLPAGSWSDDSSLTLATMRSIIECGKVDPADIMEKFSHWLKNGDYTPYGFAYDIGGATIRALERYLNGLDAFHCGGDGIRDNGNGSLMRILPLAFTDCDGKMIERVSALTHAHPIAKTACVVYVAVARCLLLGYNLRESIKIGLAYAKGVAVREEFDRLLELETFSRDEIKSSGYVIDTLEAALWCLLKTNSYRECEMLAVNLGDDTDTVGAVAGGLAGIMYGIGGEKGIPVEWINMIARKDWVEKTIGEFEKETYNAKWKNVREFFVKTSH